LAASVAAPHSPPPADQSAPSAAASHEVAPGGAGVAEAPAKAPAKASSSKPKQPKAAAKAGAATHKKKAPRVPTKGISYPRPLVFKFTRDLKFRKRHARNFINKLLGTKLEGDLESELRSGVILAKVANKLKDNAVAFKEGNDEATARSNLTNFVKAAKALGVSTFAPGNLIRGDYFPAVLRTLADLEKLALKSGKISAPKASYPSLRVPVGVPTRTTTSAGPQPKAAKGKKPAGKAPATVTKTEVDLEVPKFNYNYKSYPTRHVRKPTVTRENYVNQLKVESIPESFLLKLMTEETLHHGLIVIGFKQGLELIKQGKEYIIPPRGSVAHKTVAFNFLEFLGYKLIPTTKWGGGHLVFADDSRKAVAASILKYYETANNNALEVK